MLRAALPPTAQRLFLSVSLSNSSQYRKVHSYSAHSRSRLCNSFLTRSFLVFIGPSLSQRMHPVSFVGCNLPLLLFKEKTLHSISLYNWRSSFLLKVLGGAFTTASASPTCLLSVTSRRSLRRFRKISDGLEAPAVLNCYCRGSEDDERRFRWR